MLKVSKFKSKLALWPGLAGSFNQASWLPLSTARRGYEDLKFVIILRTGVGEKAVTHEISCLIK